MCSGMSRGRRFDDRGLFDGTRARFASPRRVVPSVVTHTCRPPICAVFMPRRAFTTCARSAPSRTASAPALPSHASNSASDRDSTYAAGSSVRSPATPSDVGMWRQSQPGCLWKPWFRLNHFPARITHLGHDGVCNIRTYPDTGRCRIPMPSDSDCRAVSENNDPPARDRNSRPACNPCRTVAPAPTACFAFTTLPYSNDSAGRPSPATPTRAGRFASPNTGTARTCPVSSSTFVTYDWADAARRRCATPVIVNKVGSIANHDASNSDPMRDHCRNNAATAASISSLWRLEYSTATDGRLCDSTISLVLRVQQPQIRVRRLLLEVLALTLLPRLRPPELIPSTLTRHDRHTASQLLQRVRTLRERRRTRVMPLDRHPVSVRPRPRTEPLRDTQHPAQRRPRRRVLALDRLDHLRLVGADSALSGRVRRVLAEVLHREPRHRRRELPVVVHRVVEVLEVRRRELPHPSLLRALLVRPDRTEVRLPRGDRLPGLVHKVALGHAQDPLLRHRVRLRSNLQVRQRARRSICQRDDVRHLRRTPPVTRAAPVQEHHNRDPTQVV